MRQIESLLRLLAQTALCRWARSLWPWVCYPDEGTVCDARHLKERT